MEIILVDVFQRVVDEVHAPQRLQIRKVCVVCSRQEQTTRHKRDFSKYTARLESDAAAGNSKSTFNQQKILEVRVRVRVSSQALRRRRDGSAINRLINARVSVMTR